MRQKRQDLQPKSKQKQRKKQGIYLMLMGVLLLVAALFLAGYNLWDEARAERAAQTVLEQMPQELSELSLSASSSTELTYPSLSTPDSLNDSTERIIPDYILNPNMNMPEMEIDGNRYIGVLHFPSLDLSLPIMSEWSYPKLKIAPCRYTGSAYQENMVIAGHNYRTHFSRLKTLSLGDEITFTDTDGNQFEYTVAGMEILEPTAIEEMTESDWDLTLFTCTYGGQTRFTVRCEAVQ